MIHLRKRQNHVVRRSINASKSRQWLSVIIRLVIDEIRQKISRGKFEFSQHAVDQSILRHITLQELRQVIASGEIIENYPDDKYGPSCLIFGITQTGRPVHIQCSDSSRPLIKVITLYEPDPEHWIDFKVRRTSHD